MTSANPIIQLSHIHKTYTGSQVPVQALKGVSLEIAQGEFTAIVGPSGSGKSSLLNIIGGLDSPSKGQVTVNGTNLSELSDSALIDFRKNNIGFVFQSFNLIPVLTALENVEFIMLLQKRSKEERHHRAKELLTAVGLADKMHCKPNQLSGGQQQRVAVARALASKPAFIIADEPTASLDSKSANNLLNIMEELNEKEKITFVFSTHDPRVVDRARRVISLNDGKINNVSASVYAAIAMEDIGR